MLPSRMFLDDFFDDLVISNNNSKFMQADISLVDGKYLIEMDMPGVKKEDIKMEIDNGYLTVSVSKNEDSKDDKKYLHRERHSYSKCSRQFYVGDVDIDSVTAKFNDGILTINIPKEEEKETKRIIDID